MSSRAARAMASVLVMEFSSVGVTGGLGDAVGHAASAEWTTIVRAGLSGSARRMYPSRLTHSSALLWLLLLL
jgi:hypothetical protein